MKIEHDGDDCVGTDEEVILSATVIGLNMPDVSWEASVGADLIPVSSTEAVFSAMDPGIYTITAIAAEDGGTRGSIEIAVQACDFELYVNSRARVSTVKSDSHPNCNPGSHEEPFIEERRRLQAKVGQLAMENELLYERCHKLEAGLPPARRRPRR